MPTAEAMPTAAAMPGSGTLASATATAELNVAHERTAAAAMRSAVATAATDDDDNDEIINVRQGYAPSAVRATASVPMTTLPDGRLVPVSEISQHMKAELQDSRWRESQNKFEERQRATNTEHGAQISIALAKLAGARPDVFGGEEEAALRRAEELKRRERERIVWDGSAFTANAAKAAVQLQELVSQAKPVVYSKTAVPLIPANVPYGVAVPAPVVPPAPPAATPLAMPPPLAPEPEAKRARVDSEPAEAPLATTTTTATPPPAAGDGNVVVSVPAGGPNGLGPTTVTVTLPEGGMDVQAVKELVSKALQGVAVGRFQLMVDQRFLKNTETVPKSTRALELKWKSK